jgi:hypothetical protein
LLSALICKGQVANVDPERAPPNLGLKNGGPEFLYPDPNKPPLQFQRGRLAALEKSDSQHTLLLSNAAAKRAEYDRQSNRGNHIEEVKSAHSGVPTWGQMPK